MKSIILDGDFMDLTEKQINIMKIAVGFSQHNSRNSKFITRRNFYNCYSRSEDLDNLIKKDFVRIININYCNGFKPKVYELTEDGLKALSEVLGIEIMWSKERVVG